VIHLRSRRPVNVAPCNEGGLPREASSPQWSDDLVPKATTHTRALRLRSTFSAFLASCLVGLTPAIRAEQASVEAAAKAAGLAVNTGTAMVNGVSIHYRDVGPRGQALILLHGFPETGDAFAPAVAALGKRYRLIVPDLRGAGFSQRPSSGYEKKTLATDVKELMDQLDIGARVAFAFAAQYPERLLSLTVAEAFIEGLAGTAEFKRLAPANPRTQHFARFARVDEAMVEHQGKEEELILSFMNSRSKRRTFVGADVTRYTASLERTGGLRAAFMGYEAFDRDASFAASVDTSGLSKVPTLAVVCENPVGNALQRQLVAAGLRNVRGVILKGCAHWVFEENPDETLAVVMDFLGSARATP
jgi:pimeloyl-ACP methyl ester carboxylesterase